MMEYKETLEQIKHCGNEDWRLAIEKVEKDLEQKELLETELKLEKDKVQYVMKQLKKQDKILNALLKNANYYYDEWYGMRGNQCIMIGITENDECFEEVREMVENYGR